MVDIPCLADYVADQLRQDEVVAKEAEVIVHAEAGPEVGVPGSDGGGSAAANAAGTP